MCSERNCRHLESHCQCSCLMLLAVFFFFCLEHVFSVFVFLFLCFFDEAFLFSFTIFYGLFSLYCVSVFCSFFVLSTSLVLFSFLSLSSLAAVPSYSCLCVAFFYCHPVHPSSLHLDTLHSLLFPGPWVALWNPYVHLLPIPSPLLLHQPAGLASAFSPRLERRLFRSFLLEAVASSAWMVERCNQHDGKGEENVSAVHIFREHNKEADAGADQGARGEWKGWVDEGEVVWKFGVFLWLQGWKLLGC